MTIEKVITMFDWTNFFVGIISLVLGVLALALSLYFYNKSKDSEKAASNTLEAIKAQTEMLKDITQKQLSRLIKNVTEQKPVEEFLTIITAMRDTPQSTLQLHLKDQEIETLTAQAIEGYIGAYFYCAVANAWSQTYLPEMENFNSEDSLHNLVRNLVDASARDFHNIESLLARVHPTRIQSNPVASYYNSTQQHWAALVKDAITAMSEKSKNRPTS